MERTGNQRFQLVTLNYDLDLESMSQHVESWILHNVSLRQTSDQNFMKILPGVKEIWSRHKIKGSNVTFSCDRYLLSACLCNRFCTSFD